MSVKIKKIQQFYENYRFETLRANEQFQNIVLESSTLVSQIIVLHSLLISMKIPACTSLFQSAQLLIFENFPAYTFIQACTFTWWRKYPTCTLTNFEFSYNSMKVQGWFWNVTYKFGKFFCQDLSRNQWIFHPAILFHPTRVMNFASFPACTCIPAHTINNYRKFSSLHIYCSLHNYLFWRIVQPAHLFHLHNYLKD